MLKGKPKNFRKREKGQVLAESFLMYTLISVVAIAALMALGLMITANFGRVMGMIRSALEVAGVFG